MEVDVKKLRLSDSHAHQKLSDFLSPFHTKTLFQENVFFDGANGELYSNLAVLRILSLKAKPLISGGISRVEEHEEAIDPVIGRACFAEPWRLLSMRSNILERVKEEFRVEEKVLVCLGGFRNMRQVYEWKGLKLELDETSIDLGTSYEIECESSEPERDKKLLEVLLKENEIAFSDSKIVQIRNFPIREIARNPI